MNSPTSRLDSRHLLAAAAAGAAAVVTAPQARAQQMDFKPNVRWTRGAA